MFALTNVLLALSLVSTTLNGVAAAPAGLMRRKCVARPQATQSAPVSAANVAPSPTASVGISASAGSKPSSADKPAKTSKPKPQGCFPSANFNPPSGTPTANLDDWWCSRNSEYAFMGFSYAVNNCPSKSAMTNDFKQMSNQFNARYVRIYAACDRDGFYDDVVDAAYDAGMGVFALVWFGFNGDDSYKGRMASLLGTVNNNPRAPYVIRNIAIGSEAMFDNAIPADALASTIRSVQGQVSKFKIEVSTSDMAYKWAANPGVIAAAAHIESNTLPFFAGNAGFGGDAWGNVNSDLQTYANQAGGKKVYLTQTGWPSNTAVWPPNNAGAVASVASEKAYYDLLDAKCATFKSGPHGGVGWFAHVFNDELLSGWGITDGGRAKFDFSPRTAC